MAFVLKEKLKVLKGDLKKWSMEVFGKLDQRIKMLMDSIEELDVRNEVQMLSLEEKKAQSKALANLWVLLRTKDAQTF
ncbi:hypothetical protein TSUD_189610 [Trifolium subterraneum]|uniref:Uncharacterized protein n=1 Tax=Trifolium subterraneum TaxID=3900 RepID=A0A2Z6LQL5_TRISU|nr:hypothetical protein TSUD_189610 [Trifolium subterraneum]